MAKTIPVSLEIHKLIKTVSVQYDVTIQEAAARIIAAGAEALQLDFPSSPPSKDEPFWQWATKAAEDMEQYQTLDMDTIEATVKKVRQRGQKKTT